MHRSRPTSQRLARYTGLMPHKANDDVVYAIWTRFNDNLYFTEQTLVDKKTKNKQKGQQYRVKLAKLSCWANSYRNRNIRQGKKPEKSQIALVLVVNLFTRIGMRALGNLNEK